MILHYNKHYTYAHTNHRLNGSSSPVLTATPHSYNKGQISTPHKIKTSERIGMKFGTVDYVLDVSPQNKFGDDRSSGRFWVNMWNIRCFVTLFFPQPTWRPHLPTNFRQYGLNDVVPRIDMPFAVKIETFSNPWPSGLKTAKIWHIWGILALLGRDLENFRSISPLTLAVS